MNDLYDCFLLIIICVCTILYCILGWNEIVYNDVITNNMTLYVENNQTLFYVEDGLKFNETVFIFVTPFVLILFWHWCYFNKFCFRYYTLPVSYICVIMVVYKCLLSLYWCEDRFDNKSVPNDSYLIQINTILNTSIITIFGTYLFAFIYRHIHNYCLSINIHLGKKYRYPLKCENILHGVCLDIYEFFIIPFIHVFVLLCLCCLCLSDSQDGHFENEMNVICFEKNEPKINYFDRMV